MAVKIGSARRDENGNYSGGKAGDQDDIEVSEQSFYVHSKGWVILRAKDSNVARLQAEAMKKACDNLHIGYDQNERDGLYAASKPYGFNPAAVEIDTETDCSALVRVCMAYAGVKVGDFYTGNEVDTIMATGMYDKLDFTSEKGLMLGDILVTKSKGHTVIVTETDNEDGGAVLPAHKFDALACIYMATSELNLRSGADRDSVVITVIKDGDTVECDGYYGVYKETIWPYVTYKGIKGYCSSNYLKRV